MIDWHWLVVGSIGLACSTFSGCGVWARGGEAVVEGYSVCDDYRYGWAPGDKDLAGYVNPDAKPEQLSPLSKVIVITYYEHLWPGKLEFLGAYRVIGRGGRVNYPLRLYPVIPFTLFGNAFEVGYAAMAFADGCWPAQLNVYGEAGPSALSRSPNHTYPVPEGAAALIRPVLYRKTRKFDRDVAWAAGWAESDGGYLLWILERHTGDIIRAIDKSQLSPDDRSWTYMELISLIENVLTIEKDPQRKAIYDAARKRFEEKIAKRRPEP